MRHAHRCIGSASLVAFAFTASCASVVTPATAQDDVSPAPVGSTVPGIDPRDGGDAPSTNTPPTGGTTGTGANGPTGDDLSQLRCHDIEARVGRAVILDADAPPRVAFEWSIEVAPTASAAQIVLPDIRTPRFTPDVPGDWLIRVRTHDGQTQLANCVIALHAQ